MKSRSPAAHGDAVPTGTASRFAKRVKAVRSMAFFGVAVCWLFLGVGVGLRLVIWPLILLRPALRRPVGGFWLRLHCRFYLRLARVMAGVRFTVTGRVPAGPAVIVMNHQGIFDIPLAIDMVQGSYPKIPTRTRYKWGIPGVSPMIRALKYPLVEQRRETARQDLEAIARAADEVARGEGPIAIFPEGHRTRDGEIGPFMVRGLRTILERSQGAPVWCVVADGLWGARTFADMAVQMAGARIEAHVLGPFIPPAAPASAEQLDAFIAEIRERMVAELARMRAGTPARAA